MAGVTTRCASPSIPMRPPRSVSTFRRSPGLTGNNNDTSGGFNDIGRRQYTLRYAGKYDLPEFGDMVLDWRGGNPVRLRDIATVDVTMRDAQGVLVHQRNGRDRIECAGREGRQRSRGHGQDLKAAVEELRTGPLARAGLDIVQVYDESTYINDSIAMLQDQPAARHRPRDRHSLVVPAKVPRDVHGGAGDPGIAVSPHSSLMQIAPAATLNMISLGRPRFRDGHGAGWRDRRARKHRAPARER